MLEITLGYLGRAHSNPTVVVNPSFVMMGAVNLKGMAEAVTDLGAGLETDALTDIMIQRCAKETTTTTAMNDIGDGTNLLCENKYVLLRVLATANRTSLHRMRAPDDVGTAGCLLMPQLSVLEGDSDDQMIQIHDCDDIGTLLL